MQENLLVAEHQSKVKTDKSMYRERRVFLFEQIVIFSEETEKKKNNLSNPGYIYKTSLKVCLPLRTISMVFFFLEPVPFAHYTKVLNYIIDVSWNVRHE